PNCMSETWRIVIGRWAAIDANPQEGQLWWCKDSEVGAILTLVEANSNQLSAKIPICKSCQLWSWACNMETADGAIRLYLNNVKAEPGRAERRFALHFVLRFVCTCFAGRIDNPQCSIGRTRPKPRATHHLRLGHSLFALLLHLTCNLVCVKGGGDPRNAS